MCAQYVLLVWVQVRNFMLTGLLGFTAVLVGAGITISFFHLDQPAKISVW